MSNLAGLVTSDKTLDLGDISDLKCRPNGLSGGAIAGIVIGCIFGLIIIILLIVVLIVFRRRPQIRDRWTRRFTQARRRFTMKGGHREADNVAYENQPMPPPYTESPVPKYTAKPQRDDIEGREKAAYASDLMSSKTIPRDSVQLKAVIDEGRFATISRAELNRDGKTTVVAVKALKYGFSHADEQLMVKKISSMKNLVPHGNIIAFIAAVHEDGNPEGPFMLLEFCEESLKTWLGNIQSVSIEDLDMMLGFTLNIASGVEHLHKHRIIHRRLAVRNVLLQRQANGLVAKLIGFGPTAEDVGTDSGAAVVPIKWLAPETLDTLDQRKPTYNEKTDAWSFGITIWEIYSLGKAPYEDVRSADVKAQLKHGLRLQCPADCHPELFAKAVSPCWEERPNKRPKFNAIVKAIDEFRRGTEQQAEGYYAVQGQEKEEVYIEAQVAIGAGNC
jgi:serine/threonine protein kinase/tetrahydromethanopterin S-methyltransferase subunit F